MKNLVGRTWGTLTIEEQEELLSRANVNGTGETIIDLTDELSVAGTVVVGEYEDEIVIASDAVIYNPAN